jgi:hypothetical protein
MRLAPIPAFTVTRINVPDGVAGAIYTVSQMRRMVNDASTDPAIINQAVSLVHMVPAKSELYEIEALFDFVLNHVRYTRDVYGVETLSDPRMTLQRLVGDCDDKATLLATLLQAVGYPTRFIMGAYEGPDFEHVYLQAFANGQWIDLDATEYNGVGWAPPHSHTLWIENV